MEEKLVELIVSCTFSLVMLQSSECVLNCDRNHNGAMW